MALHGRLAEQRYLLLFLIIFKISADQRCLAACQPRARDAGFCRPSCV